MKEGRPVEGTAIGISNTTDGCVGYFFSITNRTARSLKIRLSRNESPPAVSGLATIVQTTIEPKSEWNAALYPPDQPTPWSANLEYFAEPGPLAKKLQSIGAYFRLRPKDPQWITAQTIKINEGEK